MTAAPRMQLEELFLEAELTSKKYIVVEGRTDQRFMEAWLHDLTQPKGVTVIPVENLDVVTTSLFLVGLGDSNRDRVILVAGRADAAGVDMRCVADRDCGEYLDSHSCPKLLWTDYPALESYVLDAKTLDKANLLSFEGRLPSGSDLIAMLSPVLRDLFAVRSAFKDLSKLNLAAGVGKVQPLQSFSVAAVLPPHLRHQLHALPRSTSQDPRDYAYGHDIGGLLLAAFGNLIKNKVGLRTLEALEGALRSAMQASGTYKKEGLFLHLHEWIDD